MEKKADKTRFLELRKRALDLLGKSQPEQSDAEVRKLIIELDTNRLELELQNEDLRQAEAALALLLLKYNELYEFAPVSYLTLDPTGRIVESNKRAAFLLNRDKALLLGQKLSNFVESEDQDILHLHLLDIQETDRRLSCNLRLHASCGNDSSEKSADWNASRYVQLESIAATGRDATKGQILMTMSDVTPLHLAKTALTVLNNELAERVMRRTAKLEQTQNQLLHKEKLAAIGTLAASIAHELSNPLQGVLNVIKGIHRRVILEPEDAELVDIAVTECERMRTLLSALRDFNRPTTGIRAPLPLQSTVDSVLLLFKKECATKKIIIDVHHDEHPAQLYGVADQIKQVIMNLLRNSVDACPEGGSISIRTESRQSCAILEIVDNGRGIEPQIRDKIFEPFFSTKSEDSGTGLGLSVSYSIINKHNGIIEVDSNPSTLTRFRIKLPVRAPTRRVDQQLH